jgi:hypothetical protein
MFITEVWSGPAVELARYLGTKRTDMLSPIVLVGAAITALYSVLGAAIVRRLRKPTCRVCLYRGVCPNRETEYLDSARKQCWSCGQTTECAAPDPSLKA